jgi:ATP phosphoribosyltransferase regulatory subunit
VLELAIESLRRAGMKHVKLDLGHTGVVRGLLDLAPVSAVSVDEILSALSAKDIPALERAIADIEPRVRAGLLTLARCNGGKEVIDEARGRLPSTAAIATALDELAHLGGRCGADEVSIDLADLHGYRYLTGVTFAVHTPELPTAVLRGGRYDDIGKAFGRARPAVGFSIYLRELARLGPDLALRAIAAPADDEPSLRALIDSLRERGEVVVQALPGELNASLSDDFVFDRAIVRTNGQWQLEARNGASFRN